MAKATYIKPKPVRPPRGKVVLELTEGEADLILCLTGFIGGSNTNSPRKYARRIREALSSAIDLDYKETDAYRLHGYGNGVHFNDYPPRVDSVISIAETLVNRYGRDYA